MSDRLLPPVLRILNRYATKKSLKEREQEQKIKHREDILLVIKKVLYPSLVFCGLIIITHIVYTWLYGKHLFSEWFLIAMFGSEVVVLPFILLKIITSSLFPKR